MPIIASVSEHQPTAWPAYFFDLQMLIWIFPAGIFWCFRELRDEHVFVIIYAVFAAYFSGVMVRVSANDVVNRTLLTLPAHARPHAVRVCYRCHGSVQVA